MSTHIEFFNAQAFSDKDNAECQMKYVHALNTVQTSGEFTICGTCFDGDGLSTSACRTTNKKISCPECIKMINFCKSITMKEIEK